MPPYSPTVDSLCKYTYSAMMKVISVLTAGVKLNQVGRIIQDEARKGGYKVVNNLCSHGLGKVFHEEP